MIKAAEQSDDKQQITIRVRDIRDRLGEALRRAKYGSVRPLWADAPPDLRRFWCERGDRLIRVLGKFGLELRERPR